MGGEEDEGRTEESRKGMIEEKVEEGRKEDRWKNGKRNIGRREDRKGKERRMMGKKDEDRRKGRRDKI